MITDVTLDYSQKVSPELLAVLREYDSNVELHPDTAEYEWMKGTLRGSFRADPVKLMEDARLKGIGFHITGGSIDLGVMEYVLERLTKMIQGAHEPIVGRESVTVNVPSLGLIQIDEVVAVEDCSEGELRAHLEDGWRIICVLPNGADEGPSFMFGRTKQRT